MAENNNLMQIKDVKYENFTSLLFNLSISILFNIAKCYSLNKLKYSLCLHKNLQRLTCLI